MLWIININTENSTNKMGIKRLKTGIIIVVKHTILQLQYYYYKKENAHSCQTH